jgi:hypothetical protein
VEEGLLKTIVSNKPDSVVSAAAELINSECEDLCKRNSESILRDKSHENIMTFSWDKFYSELQLRAPGFIRVFSAAVVSVPKSLSDSKLQHVLLAAAICLQGRNREMTTVQHLIGFIMSHGSCTQRVRILYSMLRTSNVLIVSFLFVNFLYLASDCQLQVFFSFLSN